MKAVSAALLSLSLTGCLKTEYPNEKPCEPSEYPFEVSGDHEQNRETLAHFAGREEIGRYFVPTHPSKIKWSFTDNLILGEDEFALEYSEAESRWSVKDPDGQRIGTLTLLSNACWGYYELRYGTLRY